MAVDKFLAAGENGVGDWRTFGNIYGTTAGDNIQDIGTGANGVAHTIYAGDGGDQITGNTSNAAGDVFYGQAGNDTLAAGTGNTTMDGGIGNDSIVGDAGSDSIVGGDGNDIIATGAGSNRVFAGMGTDAVTGAATATNFVELGGGNDTYAGVGVEVADSIYGGDGNDTISIAAANTGLNVFEGGAGNDSLVGAAIAAGATLVLRGDDGDDVLTGATAAAASTLFGGAGNDTILAGAGADTISGGTGNDTINIVAGGNDTLTFASGDGRDTVTGFAVGDVLAVTGATRAQIAVTATETAFTVGIAGTTDSVQFSRVVGTTPTQTMSASGTAFAIQDAAIANAASYVAANVFFAGSTTTANDEVSAAATTGVGTFDLSDTSKFYSVESFDNSANVYGGSVIRGSASADSLQAATTADITGKGDQMWGRAGADTLIAGGGADTLWYGKGEGSDVITGQSSSDVIRLYNANASDVTFRMNGTALEVRIAGSTDVLTVQAYNVAANQALFVTADNLTPFSPTYSNGDTLLGSAATAALDIGSSTVLNNINNTGGAATVLRGNAGNNTILAAAAGNQLWGRGGADTLIGAAGADTFWAGSGEGSKTVSGYDVTDVDVIRLYKDNLANVTFTDNGNDLVVGYAGSSDVITVAGATGTTLQVTTADQTTSFRVAIADSGSGDIAYNNTATSYSYGTSATNTVIAGAIATATTFDLANATRFFSVENVDNSANTGASTLRGTVGNNILTAGSGGDRLWGRAGNDTLAGDAGADVFWYGANEGADVVTNFAVAADRVMLYTALSASDVSVAASSGNIVLTLGSGSLTINGGATGATSIVGNATGAIQLGDGHRYDVTTTDGTTFALTQRV